MDQPEKSFNTSTILNTTRNSAAPNYLIFCSLITVANATNVTRKAVIVDSIFHIPELFQSLPELSRIL